MPTFFLVVDELVPVRTIQCHVRIWRHAGSPPLVVSSQVPGHPPPDFCTTHLANLALGTLLVLRDPHAIIPRRGNRWIRAGSFALHQLGLGILPGQQEDRPVLTPFLLLE
jgi:hypothetical protein